jgi:hypothetical protein
VGKNVDSTVFSTISSGKIVDSTVCTTISTGKIVDSTACDRSWKCGGCCIILELPFYLDLLYLLSIIVMSDGKKYMQSWSEVQPNDVVSHQQCFIPCLNAFIGIG